MEITCQFLWHLHWISFIKTDSLLLAMVKFPRNEMVEMDDLIWCLHEGVFAMLCRLWFITKTSRNLKNARFFIPFIAPNYTVMKNKKKHESYKTLIWYNNGRWSIWLICESSCPSKIFFWENWWNFFSKCFNRNHFTNYFLLSFSFSLRNVIKRYIANAGCITQAILPSFHWWLHCY